MLPFRMSVVCNLFKGRNVLKLPNLSTVTRGFRCFFLKKIPVRLRQAGFFCFPTWNFQPFAVRSFPSDFQGSPHSYLKNMVRIPMFPAHLDLSDGSMEYLEDGLPGLVSVIDNHGDRVSPR